MKITAAQWKKLPKDLQENFTQDPDDADSYDNGEHSEDVTALKATLKKERTARKALEKKAKEREDAEGDDDEDDGEGEGDGKPGKAKPAGKPGKGDSAAKRAADRARAESEAAVKKMQEKLGQQAVRTEQERLAAALFKNPGRDGVHLANRISYELDDDGEVTIVYKDKSGNPVSDVAKLKKEFLADKEFSGIVIASKATGGGTAPSTDQAGAGGDGDKSSKGKDVDLSKSSAKDIVKALKEQGKAPGSSTEDDED